MSHISDAISPTDFKLCTKAKLKVQFKKAHSRWQVKVKFTQIKFKITKQMAISLDVIPKTDRGPVTDRYLIPKFTKHGFDFSSIPPKLFLQ